MIAKCFVCGIEGRCDVHHLIHGSNRQLADKYGLTVPLCRGCHSRVHDTGWMDERLKRYGQAVFEKDHGREEFMKIFGRSYL